MTTHKLAFFGATVLTMAGPGAADHCEQTPRIWENVNIVKNVQGDVFLNRPAAASDRTSDTSSPNTTSHEGGGGKMNIKYSNVRHGDVCDASVDVSKYRLAGQGMSLGYHGAATPTNE